MEGKFSLKSQKTPNVRLQKMVATTSHKETEHWRKENLWVFQDVFLIVSLKKNWKTFKILISF